MKTKHKWLVWLFFFWPVFLLSAQLPPAAPEIGIDEKLNTFVPENIQLYDEHFQLVNLKKLIDKPTIVSFVYFRCPGICSPLMAGMADAMDHTDMVLGKDYQAFTISFDPAETMDLGLKKKINYLHEMKNAQAQQNWRFFVGDSANIAKATDAFGFNYKKVGNDYIHAAAIMIVSPDGKITRYLYGTSFLPFEVKMALIEASKGQSGPTINKVLEYCFSYDPRGQQYVLNVTKVSGSIIIFIALIIFTFLAIKPKFQKKEVQKTV
jgi:protein SCO1